MASFFVYCSSLYGSGGVLCAVCLADVMSKWFLLFLASCLVLLFSLWV